MLEASILYYFIYFYKKESLFSHTLLPQDIISSESYFFWIRYTRYIGVSRWTTSLYTYYKLTHTGHFSKP